MTVMGSCLRCSDRMVPSVTFLRWLVGVEPIGECELCRACATARGRVALPRVHDAGRRGRVLRDRRDEAHDLIKGATTDDMRVK